MTSNDDISIHSSPGAGDQDDWSVISVVDPCGAGADGAFTDGLVRFGLPELALWARPSEGADPGADWLLTHEDRLIALDMWACDLIEGLLAPDDVQRRTFDRGQATVTFRFNRPRLAGDAGIEGLPSDRQVMVVSWSLLRRTAPRSAGPSSAGVRRVHRWQARTTAITANWQLKAAGSSRVRALAPVITGRAERFGPMSEWVRARIDQVQAAGGAVLSEFFERIPAVALVQCEHCVHEDLMRLASKHGRGGPAREAINVAQLLMPVVTQGTQGATDAGTEESSHDNGRRGSVAWQMLLGRVMLAMPPSIAGEVQNAMGSRLRAGLESLLMAAVVGDLAPGQLLAAACGSWEWAVHRGRIPGRAWLAPVRARSATQHLLSSRSGESLLIPPLREGSRAVSLTSDSELPSPADHAVGVITGLQTVAGASARPGWLLTAEQRKGLGRRQVRLVEDLAAPILTAVALPTRLHPDTWALLTAPLRDYIPDLPEQLPDPEPKGR